MSFTIWEGIYSSFQEAPVTGNGFRGSLWINKSLEKIKQIKNDFKETGTSDLGCPNQMLPVLASTVYSQKNRLKILDIGGGIGFYYYDLHNNLSINEGFEFHILEIEEICSVGTVFFKDTDNITFHSKLPEDIDDFDIIHLGSSLQYIENWSFFLSKICDFKAKYIVFTDLMAGKVATYVTVQNYYDSKIPVNIFDIDEIIPTLKEKAYKLIYQSNHWATINGVQQKLPLDHFPKELRLNHSLNCIFIMESTF